jgi:FkbM family methyltransferase
MDKLARDVRPGMTVFDVGAHTGYYTLAMSRLVGRDGKVYAFEASWRNARTLVRHLQLNNISNVAVINAAVSDCRGVARFDDNNSDYTGRLSSTGLQQVKTVRLDDYPTPEFIKMDVEGAEASVLRGAQRIIEERTTTWFLSTHGSGRTSTQDECIDLLPGHRIYKLDREEFWVLPRDMGSYA